ncbi:MAG TPA: membrane protein insertase YidC, partial [Thermoanaerobaculaceae bacterium]|nr:membrane protein insertase YidC [Thermoanaerobaculaceae bacterium]
AKIKDVWTARGSVDFAGVENRYFLVALLPDAGMTDVEVRSREPRVAEVVVRGEGGRASGTLYAGPKDHTILEAYGRSLAGTVSFGIFGFLSVGFLAALRWIHGYVGNWGVAIIVLTAGIRVLLFPLNHKATISMRRMQKLQPKMTAIQDRYKERAKKDPQVRARMNQEIMGLYKTEGINPMGGCLPNLAQLPILYALYTLFAYAIEMRQAPFAWWIKDLSLKDPTYITPILMTASWFLQQRLSPPVGDPAQRRMFMFMPLIFGLMFMNFPAGLVLYWLVNNLLTIAQQVLTQKMLERTEATA